MLKILSIDGGGSRSLLSVYIIQEIEWLLQQEKISDRFPKFDLYIGTSAGSIIASALAVDKTPSNLCGLFETLSPKIFPKPKKGIKLFKIIRELLQSKYSTTQLNQHLKDVFGDIRLGDVFHQHHSRLMIPITSIIPIKPVILKTPHSGAFSGSGKNIYLHDAITASSAAPTYFDPHFFSINSDDPELADYCIKSTDGGLYANNPDLIAITEIRRYIAKDQHLDNIKLLSIGNTTKTISYKRGAKWWGLLTGWKGNKLLQSVAALQQQHVHQLVTMNLLEKNYIRLEELSELSINLDVDIVEYKDIFKEMAKNVVHSQKDKIIDFFKK